VSGPHGFVERVARLVVARRSRPPQPASRFVTIGRNVPLAEAGCRTYGTISDFQQSWKLRQSNPTGNFRMAAMGELPVVLIVQQPVFRGKLAKS
jgi:hypothetical protein